MDSSLRYVRRVSRKSWLPVPCPSLIQQQLLVGYNECVETRLFTGEPVYDEGGRKDGGVGREAEKREGC